MMPVMHSQFQTRRAGLDSLAPLSNHLGAYEKNCAPTRPTAAGILLRAEVYTNSGHLLRRTCLSIGQLYTCRTTPSDGRMREP
jgi:hypothetical protein